MVVKEKVLRWENFPIVVEFTTKILVEKIEPVNPKKFDIKKPMYQFFEKS